MHCAVLYCTVLYPDTQLVPTVGLNIFHVELGQQEGDKKKKKRKGDGDRSVDIRELGGQLAAVWADYIKTVTSVIFVVNTRVRTRSETHSWNATDSEKVN